MPFRASRSTRSGRPGTQTDHDIFDGLPVRQWRRRETTIGAADETIVTADGASNPANDFSSDGIPELPMPKGSEHYVPWCQQMLRAARAGRAYAKPTEIVPVKAEGDNKENVAHSATASESKSAEDEASGRAQKRAVPQAFVALRWSQVPKHLEEPEQDLLAKRRKGLAPMHAMGIASNTAAMRKTKVKRVDAQGHTTVWEVMVPEGQTVDGEILEEGTLESAGVTIAAPKPGTVIEGLGIANDEGVVVASEGVTPLRRKGPVARRKKKASGRWQKKLAETDGMGVSASAEALEARRIKAKEAAERKAAGEDHEDTEMGDAHDDDGDGDGDGDDGEEDGEDGDDDREEGELSPTPDAVMEEASAPSTKFKTPVAAAKKTEDESEKASPLPTQSDSKPASPEELAPPEPTETPYITETMTAEIEPPIVPPPEQDTMYVKMEDATNEEVPSSEVPVPTTETSLANPIANTHLPTAPVATASDTAKPEVIKPEAIEAEKPRAGASATDVVTMDTIKPETATPRIESPPTLKPEHAHEITTSGPFKTQAVSETTPTAETNSPPSPQRPETEALTPTSDVALETRMDGVAEDAPASDGQGT